MPDGLSDPTPIEQVLVMMESLHQRINSGMSVCDILNLAHETFHVVGSHGDVIAKLAREGLRRAH